MKTPFTTRELVIISLFVAMQVILSQVAIPLPFNPVPISFGLVAIYVTGILLKPKHAIFVQICYLLLGAMGLPVFGNFSGGIGILFGPTGGYLLVYPIVSGIVSMALNSQRSLQSEHTRSRKWLLLKASISICLAHIVLYLGGTIWLSVTTGNSFYATLSIAVFPFISLDILKIVFCVAIIVPIRYRLLAMKLLLLK